MRKKILDGRAAEVDVAPGIYDWLDLPRIATVELSSEDPRFPIESVFDAHEGVGWRANQDGEQLLRLIFEEPVRLHHLQLQFVEEEHERTQEFAIRWSPAQGVSLKEIVRQQWTFSPGGSTREVEDYAVNLENVRVVELFIRPDLTAGRGRATLSKWRLA